MILSRDRRRQTFAFEKSVHNQAVSTVFTTQRTAYDVTNAVRATDDAVTHGRQFRVNKTKHIRLVSGAEASSTIWCEDRVLITLKLRLGLGPTLL